MNVLVCGGRDFEDIMMINGVLDELREAKGINLLIHGDARGADSLAYRWATSRGVDQVRVPANWNGRGTGAGPFRNKLMLDLFDVDLVVAFPGGKGTENMISQASQRQILILRVDKYEKDAIRNLAVHGIFQ